MSHYQDHESMPYPPAGGISEPDLTTEQSPEEYEYQTIMVTDYDKAIGDPGRFTAIVVTPNQLAELKKPPRLNEAVQYTQRENGNILFSAPLTVLEAKPLFLAANSRWRGSAATEELAISTALNTYVSSLGEMVIQSIPRKRHLH